MIDKLLANEHAVLQPEQKSNTFAKLVGGTSQTQFFPSTVQSMLNMLKISIIFLKFVLILTVKNECI